MQKRQDVISYFVGRLTLGDPISFCGMGWYSFTKVPDLGLGIMKVKVGSSTPVPSGILLTWLIARDIQLVVINR